METSGFPERLIEVMRVQRWTQQALAEKVGVTQPTIGLWLKGAEPTPTNLANLSRATGYKRDWLLYGEGRKMMREYAASPRIMEEEGEDVRFARQVISLRRQATPEQRKMVDAMIDALEKTIQPGQKQTATTSEDAADYGANLTRAAKMAEKLNKAKKAARSRKHAA